MDLAFRKATKIRKKISEKLLLRFILLRLPRKCRRDTFFDDSGSVCLGYSLCLSTKRHVGDAARRADALETYRRFNVFPPPSQKNEIPKPPFTYIFADSLT